jgi:apolipoprotein D and lipocalin family protein
MITKTRLCQLILLFSFVAYARAQPPETVDTVDLEKYAGRWYDIASYPARFQEGCHCTTAEYEIVPGKNFIRVINRCVKFKNGHAKISTAKGKAFVVSNSGNAKLKVQFFWPFRGDYLIIGLAENYSWAVVGHPNRKYLWILSRQSAMTSDTYAGVLKLVRQKGYDPSRLVLTPQNCDNP